MKQVYCKKCGIVIGVLDHFGVLQYRYGATHKEECPHRTSEPKGLLPFRHVIGCFGDIPTPEQLEPARSDEQMERLICPSCLKTTTQKEIDEELSNGGLGMCMCEWTCDDRCYTPYVSLLDAWKEVRSQLLKLQSREKVLNDMLHNPLYSPAVHPSLGCSEKSALSEAVPDGEVSRRGKKPPATEGLPRHETEEHPSGVLSARTTSIRRSRRNLRNTRPKRKPIQVKK